MTSTSSRTFSKSARPPALHPPTSAPAPLGDTHVATLVEQHLGLVIYLARRYARKYQGQHLLDLEDLVQEGVLGLMRAAERFEARKGFQFSTYATYWIRRAMGQAITSASQTIRLPDTMWLASRRLVQAQAILWQQYRREPSVDELAEAMQSEPAQVLVLLQYQQAVLSLEQPVSSEHENTETMRLGEQLAAPDDTEQRERQQEVADLLKYLTRQERQVIEWRYQLGQATACGREEIPVSYTAVGRHLQMSAGLVKSVESRALRKLRFWAEHGQRLGAAPPMEARQ